MLSMHASPLGEAQLRHKKSLISYLGVCTGTKLGLKGYMGTVDSLKR